jgi:cytochrome P450/NADPH-cytochrome P450 reductase
MSVKPANALDMLPGPRGLPVLGNVLNIDRKNPIEGFIAMAREYGPIFKLVVPGGTRVFVSGPSLVEEVCDDARFDKKVAGGLSNVRKGGASNGLFTADTDDPLWHRAHGILLTPFSMRAMRDYLPRMLDLAEQLMDKWSRVNPDDDVDVPADMTRLTLDTIALCGFGYRFNSFYRDTEHPFVAAMMRTLSASQAQVRQLPIQTRLNIRARHRVEADDAFMAGLVDKLIQERRALGNSADNSDLLGRMLTGVDKKSGERLPDENIRAQCITFLVAGHETTSGLLSFAIYYLLKNPDVVQRAQAEVDRVLGGTRRPTYEQVQQLRYVRQILDEALRLWPTAPGFTRQPYKDTVIGGQYRIPKGAALTVLLAMLHRDPGVWGPDADRFDPDHTSPDRMSTLPAHAYKPFGTGQRACIGRQFALQEAVLVLGMLLQRFELIDHFDYELKIKTSLTVKPEDLRIRVRPRHDRLLDAPTAVSAARKPAQDVGAATAPKASTPRVHGTPLAILYGSNLGTAEGIANRLSQEATERGFSVTLGALDDQIDVLRSGGAVVIVCSSYNGAPPDNAVSVCRWLRDDTTPRDACAGVSYSVFGCGNTEWAATYQAVPTMLDTQLEAHGARRIRARGAADARGDFDAQYRTWHGHLWRDFVRALELPTAVAERDQAGPRLSLELVNRQVTNPVIMSYRAKPALVRSNRELHGPDGTAGRSTRHVEIALPSGATYHAGDHLGVLPRNGPDLIRRVMQRFALDAGMYVTITPNNGTHTHLPIGEPAPLLGVLGACVELQDVATRGDIEVLASYATDPERSALEQLFGDDEKSQARYREAVLSPNRSILDLLEAFPACTVPFEVYLDRLAPLRPRYYSISSSPMVSPQVCSITAGVVNAPARSGAGMFTGVCSSHLARSGPNSTLFVFVRQPTIAFRPPDNPHIPMIMVGAGTGLAPFRGFLQERSALVEQGVPVGESLLFFGCRSPEADYLYADELRDFEARGVVTLQPVFSRAPVDGRRYVQHAMKACQNEVWELIDHGAAIFVCGNATTIAPAVRATLQEIFLDNRGGSPNDADAWLAGLRAEDRFVEDIWGG